MSAPTEMRFVVVSICDLTAAPPNISERSICGVCYEKRADFTMMLKEGTFLIANSCAEHVERALRWVMNVAAGADPASGP